MKISEVIDHIKALHAKEKTQFTKVAYKPLKAYLVHVAKQEDADIVNLFPSIDNIFVTFQGAYQPNTVRNYIRLLRQTMDLDIISPLIKNKESIIDKFNTIIKQADQAAKDMSTAKQIDTTTEEESSESSVKTQPTDIVSHQKDDTISQQNGDESKLLQSQIENARLSATCLCLKEQNDKLWNLVQHLLNPN